MRSSHVRFSSPGGGGGGGLIRMLLQYKIPLILIMVCFLAVSFQMGRMFQFHHDLHHPGEFHGISATFNEVVDQQKQMTRQQRHHQPESLVPEDDEEAATDLRKEKQKMMLERAKEIQQLGRGEEDEGNQQNVGREEDDRGDNNEDYNDLGDDLPQSDDDHEDEQREEEEEEEDEIEEEEEEEEKREESLLDELDERKVEEKGKRRSSFEGGKEADKAEVFIEEPEDSEYSSEGEDEQHNDVTDLTDEITYIFAAININRTAHLGKEGKEYKFEEDYIAHINWFLDFLSPFPTEAWVEERYFDLVRPHLHSRAGLRPISIADLKGFPYFERIEEIRTSDWWIKFTPWLAGVPQGYSPYYNPIVMQKVLWLYDMAKRNPFKTKYFVWLDSGGICSPTIQLHGKDYLNKKLMWHLSHNRFFITRSPYGGGRAAEIHGCDMRKLKKLVPPDSLVDHVCKGWIMGGTFEALDALVPKYLKLINDSLSVGCLGTEETLFSILYHSHPELIHAFDNGEPYNPNLDNVCKFFVEPQEDQTERERKEEQEKEKMKAKRPDV